MEYTRLIDEETRMSRKRRQEMRKGLQNAVSKIA